MRALALLQLRDLLASLLKRTQGPAHCNPLQQQNQQQRCQTEAKPELLHAPEAFAYRRVILGDTDGNRHARTSIVRAQHQQLLPFRPQLQVAVQAGVIKRRQFLIP
ncbi:hypothetical protein D3C85_1501880 [compost metagenome]